VQEEEKAFALGVQFVMLRLFGKQPLVVIVVVIVVAVVSHRHICSSYGYNNSSNIHYCYIAK